MDNEQIISVTNVDTTQDVIIDDNPRFITEEEVVDRVVDKIGIKETTDVSNNLTIDDSLEYKAFETHIYGKSERITTSEPYIKNVKNPIVLNQGNNLFDTDVKRWVANSGDARLYLPIPKDCYFKIADNDTSKESFYVGVCVNDKQINDGYSWFANNKGIVTSNIKITNRFNYLVLYFNGKPYNEENFKILFDRYKIMVSKNDIEYEPYREPTQATYQVSLNGIDDVQDELIIYKDGSGKLIQRNKSITLNGSESLFTNGNSYRLTLRDMDISNSTLINVVASHFNSIAYNDKWDYTNSWVTNDKSKNIVISLPNISSLDDFKAWLNDNNVTVVYKLATPIETELSQLEVLQLLGDVNNVSCDGDLKITYIVDTTKYIDKKFNELANAIVSAG